MFHNVARGGVCRLNETLIPRNGCPVLFLPRHRSKMSPKVVSNDACEFEQMFNDHSFWLVGCLQEVHTGDQSAMSLT